jgi:hypothetical protein
VKTLLSVAVVLGVVLAGLAWTGAKVTGADTPATGKIFELREYKAKPGKFDALNARFRDHTCQLFKKHGIEVVGFWIPTDENADTLLYMVSFPSVEAQKKAWEAFRADPEWVKAKADSEKDGPLLISPNGVTTKNYKATDYSPIK